MCAGSTRDGDEGRAGAGDAAADGPVRPPRGRRLPRGAVERAAIEGLTEPLFTSKEAVRSEARISAAGATGNDRSQRLDDAKLVTVARDAGGALVAVDAHPLLREYFAKRLREAAPAS